MPDEVSSHERSCVALSESAVSRFILGGHTFAVVMATLHRRLQHGDGGARDLVEPGSPKVQESGGSMVSIYTWSFLSVINWHSKWQVKSACP